MRDADPALATVRERCPRCRQAQTGCWCDALPALPHGDDVVLLQHPREARNTLGTARMAHLALPGSRLLVGVRFAEHPEFVARLARDVARSIVLYPAPDARPLEDLPRDGQPRTLWVIDGTWSQARKMWRENPALHALPAYRLSPPRPSEYVIRREPAPHCLSTVEAMAAALDVVHGTPGAHTQLVAPLHRLVARQLAYATSDRRAPRRLAANRARRVPTVPLALADAGPRALLVHAEGVGRTGHARPRPPADLVQWLALRPATGERFAMLVQPAQPLTDAICGHLELGAPAIAAAASRDDFARAWRAFVRDDDVWCAWNQSPAAMLAAAGLDAPATLDLRALVGDRLRAHAGRLDDCAQRLGLVAEPAWAPGRGGRRLALLTALYARLVTTPQG